MPHGTTARVAGDAACSAEMARCPEAHRLGWEARAGPNVPEGVSRTGGPERTGPGAPRGLGERRRDECPGLRRLGLVQDESDRSRQRLESERLLQKLRAARQNPVP